MRYYAMQPQGELCRQGGPGTLVRFATRQERDEWVRTHHLAEVVPANHIWVKQAKWMWTRDGEKPPKDWTRCAIMLVSYDMTQSN